MNRAIFKKAVFDRKISTTAWCITLGAFAMLYASLFSTFAGNIGNFASSLPKEMEAFTGSIQLASRPEGFLGIELYGLLLPIILAVVGLTFGAGAIGKEEDDGTLDVLLANPISRHSIIIQKIAAIKVTLLIICGFTWLAIALGKLLFEFEVNLINVGYATLAVYLLAMIYAMAAFATQAITGKRNLGIAIGSGLLAFTYVADVVSKLVSRFENLKYISPFYYYDFSNVLFGNGTIENFIILAVVSVGLYAVAHFAFLQRDTSV